MDTAGLGEAIALTNRASAPNTMPITRGIMMGEQSAFRKLAKEQSAEQKRAAMAQKLSGFWDNIGIGKITHPELKKQAYGIKDNEFVDWYSAEHSGDIMGAHEAKVKMKDKLLDLEKRQMQYDHAAKLEKSGADKEGTKLLKDLATIDRQPEDQTHENNITAYSHKYPFLAPQESEEGVLTMRAPMKGVNPESLMKKLADGLLAQHQTLTYDGNGNVVYSRKLSGDERSTLFQAYEQSGALDNIYTRESFKKGFDQYVADNRIEDREAAVEPYTRKYLNEMLDPYDEKISKGLAPKPKSGGNSAIISIFGNDAPEKLDHTKTEQGVVFRYDSKDPVLKLRGQDGEFDATIGEIKPSDNGGYTIDVYSDLGKISVIDTKTIDNAMWGRLAVALGFRDYNSLKTGLPKLMAKEHPEFKKPESTTQNKYDKYRRNR